MGVWSTRGRGRVWFPALCLTLSLTGVSAQTLESLDITPTEQGLEVVVGFNAPHQFSSVFPRRESDTFMVRLRPVPIAGNERKRSERSRLPIPKEYRDKIESLIYETSPIDGTYIILNLYQKAAVQVREGNDLNTIRIGLEFVNKTDLRCEPTAPTTADKAK